MSSSSRSQFVQRQHGRILKDLPRRRLERKLHRLGTNSRRLLFPRSHTPSLPPLAMVQRTNCVQAPVNTGSTSCSRRSTPISSVKKPPINTVPHSTSPPPHPPKSSLISSFVHGKPSKFACKRLSLPLPVEPLKDGTRFPLPRVSLG